MKKPMILIALFLASPSLFAKDPIDPPAEPIAKATLARPVFMGGWPGSPQIQSVWAVRNALPNPDPGKSSTQILIYANLINVSCTQLHTAKRLFSPEDFTVAASEKESTENGVVKSITRNYRLANLATTKMCDGVSRILQTFLIDTFTIDDSAEFIINFEGKFIASSFGPSSVNVWSSSKKIAYPANFSNTKVEAVLDAGTLTTSALLTYQSHCSWLSVGSPLTIRSSLGDYEAYFIRPTAAPRCATPVRAPEFKVRIQIAAEAVEDGKLPSQVSVNGQNAVKVGW